MTGVKGRKETSGWTDLTAQKNAAKKKGRRREAGVAGIIHSGRYDY
jgi:hypothetical protein